MIGNTEVILPTDILDSVVVPRNGVSMRRSPMSIARLWFFLRWGFCFSFRLRRMLFSTMFLYALCMSLRLCAGWGSVGEVDAASFEPASLRA
jgi:hypothetical protein